MKKITNYLSLISIYFLLFSSFNLFSKDSFREMIDIESDEILMHFNEKSDFRLTLNQSKYEFKSNYLINDKEYELEKIEFKKCEIVSKFCFEIKGFLGNLVLERKIVWNGHFFKIFDSLKNNTDKRIILKKDLFISYPEIFSKVFISGTNSFSSFFTFLKDIIKYFLSFFSDVKHREIYSPENSSFHIEGKFNSVGYLNEDLISKVKSKQSNIFFEKKVRNSTDLISIKPNKEIILEFSIFPQIKEEKNYYQFVNLVRKKKNINSYLNGQFSFLNVIEYEDVINDKEKLNTFLNENKMRIIVLTPWLDYDNFNISTGKFIKREDYKLIYTNVINKIKNQRKDVKLLGAIQSNLVSLPADLQKEISDLGHVDRNRRGIIEFNSIETNKIKEYFGNWRKSDFIEAKNGNFVGEIQFYGKNKNFLEISIAVIPRIGSAQEKNIFEQVRFLIDELKMDGIYLDQFNQNVSSKQRQSYGKNDEISFDGSSHYEDTLISTEKFQINFLSKLASEGLEVVTNSTTISKNHNSQRYSSFYEGFWEFFSNETWKSNSKPPSSMLVAKGHFNNPVSLGMPNWMGGDWKKEYEKVLFKNIIFYLRNGSLFYHNQTNFVNFDDSYNKYEVFNEMFPFNIKKIGEGWLRGEKKIITCVSQTIFWPHESKPLIKIFKEEEGDIIKFDVDLNIFKKKSNGWEINLKIKDWNEIAIIS